MLVLQLVLEVSMHVQWEFVVAFTIPVAWALGTKKGPQK
jgi:hypothetical protein